MIGRLAERAVLVMLVCTTSILADDDLAITDMTWSYTPGDGGSSDEKTELVVCTGTETLASENDFIRLSVKSADSETSFEGTLQTEALNCALFSENEELKMPSEDETLYKMTVSNTTDQLHSGTVSFANPVTKAEMIDCEGTSVGRLTLSKPVDADNCFPGSGFTDSLCYVDIVDESTVCLSGLDTLGSEVQVCTPITPDPAILPPGNFTADYIDYTTSTVSITHDVVAPSVLTELLSRSNDSMSVHTCTDDACDLRVGGNAFTPSIYNYELCGVFFDGDAVTNVGTTAFQDLLLTIDSTSPTVDFHFYNVAPRTFNVYEGADLDTLDPEAASFTLDCTHIPEDNYCNGFLPSGDNPTTIAVSFEDGTNAVGVAVTYDTPQIQTNEEVGSLAAGVEEAGTYRQQ